MHDAEASQHTRTGPRRRHGDRRRRAIGACVCSMQRLRGPHSSVLRHVCGAARAVHLQDVRARAAKRGRRGALPARVPQRAPGARAPRRHLQARPRGVQEAPPVPRLRRAQPDRQVRPPVLCVRKRCAWCPCLWWLSEACALACLSGASGDQRFDDVAGHACGDCSQSTFPSSRGLPPCSTTAAHVGQHERPTPAGTPPPARPRARAGRPRRKVTGNLKLVHEMYGPKAPHVPHEVFKQQFVEAIAHNEEIDKHFSKARRLPAPHAGPARARGRSPAPGRPQAADGPRQRGAGRS